MTPFQMYLLILLTKLPNIGMVMWIGGFIGIVMCGMLALFNMDIYLGTSKAVVDWSVKGLKVSAVTFAVGLLINFFGVDMKQLALIYGVPAVVNNEQAQKLPNNVLNVVNTWLEEQAKEEQK